MNEIDGYVYQFDSSDNKYKYYFFQASKKVLGTGAFGKVYRCLRVKTNDPKKKEIVIIEISKYRIRGRNNKKRYRFGFKNKA